jgi:hypothetical protein
MATNSTQESLYGTGFSPLRGEPAMGMIPVPLFTVSTLATAGVVTYTAAQLLGGLILRDTNGDDRSDVLPTATALFAAIPGATVGQGFYFDIRNTADASETITVTAGTGGTVSGTATIAESNGKRFLLVLTGQVDPNNGTGTAAYTAYSLGTYTF